MSKEERGAGLVEPPVDTEEAGARRTRRVEQDGGAASEDGAAHQQGPSRGVIREYFESLVVTAIMALFGMTFVVQAVKVPTGSMQNTIKIGDHLLVNKFIFAPGPVLPFLPQREIRRSDIIVFKYPGKFHSPQFERYNVNDDAENNTPFKTNYVKRVIGLPGDHVEIKDARVFVNGEPLAERRVAATNPPDADDPDTSGDERGAELSIKDDSPRAAGEGAYTVYWSPDTLRGEDMPQGETVFDVPAEHYLVLGDNRENSQDSRFWGFVPRHLIIGRAMFVYWSFDESLPRGKGTFGFISDFFQNTRWSRTGTLVR
jgi:signal peptidase I